MDVTPGGIGLLRSREHRVIAGVCGGFAESVGMRPWVVRALFVGFSLLTAVIPGAVVYAVLWRFLPERKPLSKDAEALGMFVDPEDPTGGYRL